METSEEQKWIDCSAAAAAADSWGQDGDLQRLGSEAGCGEEEM